jgi:hypothetical protein
MGEESFARPRFSRACLALLVCSLGGCGSLLGVDHDWDLVDGEADDAALLETSTIEAAADVTNVAETSGTFDSATPGLDATGVDVGSADGACTVGSLSCSGAQPQICNNAGTWQNVGAACTGSMPACLGGACVDCTPGSLGCNGQQPEKCDATGTWQNMGAACSGQACVGGSCTGDCSPGALECVNTYWFVCSSSGGWQLVGTQC